MRRNRRTIPEINAASMADIAFLLLIFYLVATTMSVDTGLQRLLPPMADQKSRAVAQVKKRNIFLVNINKADEIMAGGVKIDISQLADRVAEFVANQNDAPTLPEKTDIRIDGLGIHPVSQAVVSLQNDRATSYETYVKVQNELTRAYTLLRDRVAVQHFGRRFAELGRPQREAVRQAVPMRISEAEPYK